MSEPSVSDATSSEGDGEVIDGELLFDDDPSFNWFREPSEDASSKASSRDSSKTEISSGPVKAKSGPPTGDEWLDFFSRVLVRSFTNFYVDRAFSDIDEEQLTDREYARIYLSETERNRIARPFAEFSLKNKFMRKHGRSIVATAGSVDSIIQLGMWMNRVNRIAAKYRAPDAVRASRRNRNDPHRSARQAPVYAPARPFNPTVVPETEEGGTENERTGQASQNGRPRPTIAGEVFNPYSG